MRPEVYQAGCWLLCVGRGLLFATFGQALGRPLPLLDCSMLRFWCSVPPPWVALDHLWVADNRPKGASWGVLLAPGAGFGARRSRLCSPPMEARRWAIGGARVVRELRWLVPIAVEVVACLRAEIRPLESNSDSQLRAAAEPLGIPVREGEYVSWGHDFAPWRDARDAWQVPRSCVPQSTADHPSVCAVCHGACHLLWGRLLVNVCPWCGLPSAIQCPACGVGVHYRGQCRRWPCGASLRYTPYPSEERRLRPDCWWEWVQAFSAAAPARRLDATPAVIDAHMRDAASRLCLGAGALAPAYSVRLVRVRRAKRWIVRFLRNRAWVHRCMLVAAGAEAVGLTL